MTAPAQERIEAELRAKYRRALMAAVGEGLRLAGEQTKDLRVLGALADGTILVEVLRPGDGAPPLPPVRGFWFVVDNGGEIDLRRLNTTRSISIPYEQDRQQVDFGTVAGWVWLALRGVPRDYSARAPLFIEELREVAATTAGGPT